MTWAVGVERETSPGVYATLVADVHGWTLWRLESSRGQHIVAGKAAIGRQPPVPLGSGAAIYGGAPRVDLSIGERILTSVHGQHFYKVGAEMRVVGERFTRPVPAAFDPRAFEGQRVEFIVRTMPGPKSYSKLVTDRGIVDFTGVSEIIRRAKEPSAPSPLLLEDQRVDAPVSADETDGPVREMIAPAAAGLADRLREQLDALDATSVTLTRDEALLALGLLDGLADHLNHEATQDADVGRSAADLSSSKEGGRGPETYSVGLRGESNYQPAIHKTFPGEAVTLAEEPSNPHDPRAVQVFNRRGDLIGYLPRGGWLTDMLIDQGLQPTCTVKSVAREEYGKPYGVVIEVRK